MVKKFHPLGAYQRFSKVFFWPISKNAKKILSNENLMHRNYHNNNIMHCVNSVIYSYAQSTIKSKELEKECSSCVDAILDQRAIWDYYGFEFKYGDLQKAKKLSNDFCDKVLFKQIDVEK